MTLQAQIERLTEEVRELAQRQTAQEAPTPAEPASAAADAADHHKVSGLISEIEAIIENVGDNVDEHPRIAVLAAFGLGLTIGLTLPR